MRPRRRHRYPLSLSDQQLKMVMDAAKPLDATRRYSYLLRLESKLNRNHMEILSDALLANCIQSTLDEVLA